MKEVSSSLLSFMKKNDNIMKNIELLNNSNTDYIHLDVMDNKFVDNKFLSKTELPKVLDKINKKIDIHFMVNDPKPYLEKISLYNISYITIHYEIKNVLEYINMIKNYGFKVGISIKPETKVNEILNILDKVNLVLVMSVNPGQAGQEFIKETKEKIEELKQEINKRGLSTKIEVDGGINEEVLEFVSDADILVAGTYLLEDINNINKLK